MKKQAIVYSLLASMMALTAACSSDKTDGTAPGDARPADNKAATEVKKQPVELVFYTPGAGYDETFMDIFGSEIQKKFPYITVKFLSASTGQLADLIASGQTIDVLLVSIGQSNMLTAYNYQYDISELLKSKKFDLSHIEPSAVELQKGFANNGMYGLPVFTNTLANFYNKDIFDKFGVEYPKDGLTWDQLKDLAKRLSRTEGGKTYNGLVMSSSANIGLNQFSVAYIDPVAKKSIFTSEKFKQAFNLLTSVAQLPGNGLTEDTWSLAGQQKMFFQDQTAAMLLHFVNTGLTTLKEQFDWDIASYPQLPNNPGVGASTYPTYLYVTKTSKYKEDAFDAIAYLTTDEFQTGMAKKGMLPILKDKSKGLSEFGKDNPLLKNKNVKALIPDKYAPSALISTEIVTAQSPGNAAFFEAYQNVVLGTKDANTALREAGEKYDAKLAELFK
ncbi:ABC transporter substrate-binding protein [Paenibacillus ginsengarvi]|uniref:Extracellular solute-binding protein n=1 Tax=Paenibacillus ginsengarvi TaxID=400777 RepID=A0A3B0CMY1_9BACL|nr:extracellular solute-binding protein [Paenibacillus ginsengarvi]RKN86108.1 extracellular solute-binding protein [Paenibacillus ginsengarvi]